MLGRLLQLDLEQAIVWQEWEQTKPEQPGLFDFYAGAASAAVGLISFGYVFWGIRGGALAVVITSTLPTWRLVDPTSLLTAYRASTTQATDRIEEMLR